MRLVAFDRVHLVSSITFVVHERHGILMRIPIFAMIWGVRMCEFCCKIGKLEKIKQGAFKGGYYPEKNETQIVEFESAFHLFFGCSDPFMSGIGIEDIKFCPMCGRKLV